MAETWTSEFSQQEGEKFLRVWAKCLILAFYNYSQPREKKRNDFRTSPLKSNVWNSFNKWLHFQIKFINQRDWARSPVILAVAGGYSENLDLGLLPSSEFDRAIAKDLARKYVKGFNFFNHESYENWILKVLIVVRSAEKMTGLSLLNSNNSVAEIGPGMGSMVGIAHTHFSPSFISFDTFEMQIIQRYVAKCLEIPKEICIFSPINLEGATSKAEIPTAPYVLFAFWSFTEVDIAERFYYHDLIENSYATVIACNNTFEGVNNFKYLDDLAVTLNKKFISKIFTVFLVPVCRGTSKSTVCTLFRTLQVRTLSGFQAKRVGFMHCRSDRKGLK